MNGKRERVLDGELAPRCRDTVNIEVRSGPLDINLYYVVGCRKGDLDIIIINDLCDNSNGSVTYAVFKKPVIQIHHAGTFLQRDRTWEVGVVLEVKLIITIVKYLIVENISRLGHNDVGALVIERQVVTDERVDIIGCLSKANNMC